MQLLPPIFCKMSRDQMFIRSSHLTKNFSLYMPPVSEMENSILIKIGIFLVYLGKYVSFGKMDIRFGLYFSLGVPKKVQGSHKKFRGPKVQGQNFAGSIRRPKSWKKFRGPPSKANTFQSLVSLMPSFCLIFGRLSQL